MDCWIVGLLDSWMDGSVDQLRWTPPIHASTNPSIHSVGWRKANLKSFMILDLRWVDCQWWSVVSNHQSQWSTQIHVSLMPKRVDGIDFRRAASGNPAGQNCRACEKQSDGGERHRIRGLNFEQQVPENSGQGQGSDQSNACLLYTSPSPRD